MRADQQKGCRRIGTLHRRRVGVRRAPATSAGSHLAKAKYGGEALEGDPTQPGFMKTESFSVPAKPFQTHNFSR